VTAAASVAAPSEPTKVAVAADVEPASPLGAASAPPAGAASAADTSIVVEPDALAAATTAGVLQLHTSAESWVEVTDASGQSLITRVLQPGETVGLDGTLPLKLIVGNVAGTQVVFRGQPMELTSHTRDNVARLELK
jgi:cytoskeleton protein RodZ